MIPQGEENQMAIIKQTFTSILESIMEYQQIRAERIVRHYSWIR